MVWLQADAETSFLNRLYKIMMKDSFIDSDALAQAALFSCFYTPLYIVAIRCKYMHMMRCGVSFRPAKLQ